MKQIQQKKSFIHLLYFILFFFAIFFLVSLIIRKLGIHEGKEHELSFSYKKDFHIGKKESIPAKLIRIVDGDTLLVELKGRRERLRLIGIDSPESVKPESPVECYGEESKAYLKSILPEGSDITLEYDETQGERDRFGRILAYVFTNDGKNLAEEMLRNGYAREYNYQKRNPYRLRDTFVEDEKGARAKEKGLWAVCH